MRGMVFGLMAVLMADAGSIGQTTVHFTIDGQSEVKPISRLIYGINQPIVGEWADATFTRLGGNRTTAYNWVTNASNAGKDYKYVNDDYFTGGATPSGAVIPVLRNAYEHDAGAVITVPMAGYVSGDEAGPVDIHDPARFAKRFKLSEPVKGSAFTLHPDAAAPVVYQDEFINWVKTNYGYGQTDANRPIYFELDNEPDVWAETHPEIHPAKLTYAEIIQRTIAYSKAIKNVEPNALVYGPVHYGWGGMATLQEAPDGAGRDFETFYLSELAAASKAAGKRLVDVLDIHWYPEAQGGGVRITGPEATAAVVAARLQAPRSLWDADYTETSWITRDALRAPIDLIPILQKKIDDNFPGMKLSVSEYNYGGGADISGGIAEADVLGLFGKLGVYSANEWTVAADESFIAAAMAMYRNFDGKKGSFGDTSVSATTDDVADTSVYAGASSADSNEMTLIAINKTANPITAEFQLQHCGPFDRADIFQLTRAKAKPVPGGRLTIKRGGDLSYRMPAMSVSSIRLVAIPGVFR